MAVIEISGYKVEIDDEDLDKVMQKKWYIRRADVKYGLYYFVANGSRKKENKQNSILLHRFIMNCTPNDGTIIDHMDKNTLNNKKSNLRVCTHADNMRNRSKECINKTGYKGVYRRTFDGYYVAAIHNNDRPSSHIYQSRDLLECVKWYDMIAIKLHGEFACINLPKENYTQEDIDKAYEFYMSQLGARNTSGYRGVSLNKKEGKYAAQLTVDSKFHWLGWHKTPESAAIAYDAKAFELLGQKAKLNFPERVVNGVYNKEIKCDI